MGVEPATLEDATGRSAASPGTRSSPADHSLFEGIEALFEDGKTYFDSELAFQKSRAGFAASNVKWVAVYGLGALALLHLALIGLVVGALLSLAASLGFVLATVIVVSALALGAWVFASKLKSRLSDIVSVFGGER